MADLNYFESGYIEAGYYTYTADAGSAIESSASVTVSVGVIKSSTVSLAAEFTQTATISNQKGADLFAFTDAQLAVQVSIVKDNNVQLTSVFSTAIDGSRGIYVTAQADSQFDVSSLGSRFRALEAAQSAAFSLTADGAIILAPTTAEASLSSEFTQTASAIRLISTPASISAETTFAITETVYNDASASLSSDVQVSATANIIKQTSSAISAESTQTTSFGKIVSASADLSDAFIPNLTVSVFKNSFAVLDSVSSLSTTVEVTKTTSSAINATANQTILATANTTGQANVSATANITALGYIIGQRPHPVAVVGSPTFSTDRVLGSHSLYIPTNTSNGVRTLYPSDNFYFDDSQDFNIEFFTKPTPVSFNNYNKVLLSATISGNPTLVTGWTFYYNYTNNYLQFQINRDTGGLLSPLTLSYTLPGTGSLFAYDRWNYIRAYRSAGVIYLQLAYNTSGTTWTTPTTVASSAYSGAIGLNGYAGSKALYLSTRAPSTDSRYAVNQYIDEIFVSKNSTQRAMVGNVPTAVTYGRDESTSVLYHLNNDYVDDMSGIALFQAALTSTSALSAQATPITREASASLSAEGFVVAAFGRIRPAVDIEVAEFALDITTQVNKPFSSVLASEATVAADVTKQFGQQLITCDAVADLSSSAVATRTTNAQLTAKGFVVAAFGRIRPFVDIQTSEFTLSAQVEAGKIAFADFAVNSALSATVTKDIGQQLITCPATSSLSANVVAIPSGGVNAAVQSSLSVVSGRVRYNESSITAEATESVTATITQRLAGTLSANSTISVEALRIKPLTASFDVIASELVATSKVGRIIVDIPNDTTLSANVSVLSSGSIALESQSSLAIATSVNKPHSANLEATTQLVSQAEAGIIGQSTMSAAVSAQVITNVTGSAQATVTAVVTVTVNTGTIKPGIILEASAGTMSVTARNIRGGEIYPSSSTQLVVQGGRLQPGQATLQVNAFVLSIGKVINLEASEVYIIPRDVTTWIIKSENNEYIIPFEDREYTIEGI